jgi:hypothetical protein
MENSLISTTTWSWRESFEEGRKGFKKHAGLYSIQPSSHSLAAEKLNLAKCNVCFPKPRGLEINLCLYSFMSCP